MDLAKRTATVASLLASLAALWALFRRFSTRKRPPTANAGEEASAAEATPAITADSTAAAEEAPVVVKSQGGEAGPEPEPEESAKPPAAGETGTVTAGREPPRAEPPKRTPSPEEEARAIAEDPRLEPLIQAAVRLHSRSRQNLESAASVQTAYLPDLSASNSIKELVIPQTYVFGFLGLIQALGLACLGSAIALGFGATIGIVGICALALMSFSLLAHVESRPAYGAAAEAVHAVATVQHDAVHAVWRMVVAWAAEKPGRGIAWKNGLAFLVEAKAGAVLDDAATTPPSQYNAFVLETGPLRVHHYMVRPYATSAHASEASWNLREFLGKVKSQEGVIVNDSSQQSIVGQAFAPRTYKKVRVILSQKETSFRLTELPPLLLLDGGLAGGAQEASVFVSPVSRMPKPWLGFGGSFTESSATTLAKMPADQAEKVLQAYFNPQTGLAYTIGRISMGSCDFGLGNWTCGDLKDGDHELKDFSIEHYHKEILPMYKRAAEIAGAPLWMLASPWSPPPWMKTKKMFPGDAHLKPECGKAWALHFVRFVQEMAKVGVRIMAVTVQNEPEAAQRWESCIYTAAEERDFVRDHLGPTFWASGLESVKILVWDHNRDGMFERAQIAYADPEAAKYIWGCAYHWYGDARFEAWPDRSEVHHPDRQQDWKGVYEIKSRLGLDNLRRVAELRPDKHILFSEGCQELAGVPLGAILHEWKFGERYAMNIIADMNNGCEGWIDWNLLLDEVGGPNHVGNFCLAPVVYDQNKKEIVYAPPYYFLGHFSRFIRPGARRVLCSTSRDVLEVTAWANSDGSVALVVLNQSGGIVDFKLKVGGDGTAPMQALPVRSPPNSIMTLVLE